MSYECFETVARSIRFEPNRLVDALEPDACRIEVACPPYSRRVEVGLKLQREGLDAPAENVPGVNQVENRIVCLEPFAGSVTYDLAAPM